MGTPVATKVTLTIRRWVSAIDAEVVPLSTGVLHMAAVDGYDGEIVNNPMDRWD